jgi:hypothetical protein
VRRRLKAGGSGSSDAVGRALRARRLALPIIGAVCALCLIFGAGSALAATPEGSIGPTTVTPGYTKVEFSGEVNPDGDEAEWFSEYSADGGASWNLGSGIGFSEAGVNSPLPFTNAALEGLALGTTYKIRLGFFDYTREELLPGSEPGLEFTTKSVDPPTATLLPITTETDTTAVLKGKIDPNSPGGLDEEGKNVYATDYAFHCSPECPDLAGGTVPAEASGAELEVEAHVTGLEPNKEYTVTLTANNRGGEVTDGPQAFTTETMPPTVRGALGASTGEGSYLLQGAVNPHNSQVTSCKFEYGATEAYGQSAPCEPLPATTNSNTEVTARIGGLTLGAFYHYKLVVETTAAGGHGESTDIEFSPTAIPAEPICGNELLRAENNSLALPECRAYEQISPVLKAGYKADLFGFSEGNSVLYRSGAGNIANSGQGYPTGSFYVAERTAGGWETVPNLNSGSTLFSGPEALTRSHYTPTFYSDDLRSSYWFVAPGGTFSDEWDSYLRNPDGRFTLIGHGTPRGANAPVDIKPVGGSADLSHVVLEGVGSEPGVYEFVGTGNSAPRRVDLDDAGQPISGCNGSSTPIGPRVGAEGKAVSSDGRTIIFIAVGGCGSGPPADEVWARVDGTSSYDASESHCSRIDCNAPAPARFAGAARDGSSVFFTTTQQLLNSDTDNANDLYVYHLPTATDPNPSPALTEVSGSGPGANTEEGVRVSPAFLVPSTVEGVTVSSDGSTAMFVSSAVLAGNDDAYDEAAHQGDENLYVWHSDAADPEGEVMFVGRLARNDLAPAIEGAVHTSEMTPDGRYVVFNTASSLVPTDADDGYDVYRYDTESGRLARVSTGPLGAGGNAGGFNAYLASPFRGTPTAQTGDPWPSPLSISADGKDIVFATTEGLVDRDGNGTTDVYLWKAGRVSLISSGTAGNNVSDAEFAVDASGQDIYFVTGDPLSSTDADAIRDVYDARVGGGFSAPKTIADCIGEACQPVGAGSPYSPSPATSQTRAPESSPETPPKRCRKGKVLKKGRCVKQHEKQGKHHKKHKGKRGAKKRGGAR